MVAITFKNNGAWGTGKGSRLTSLEADDNLFSLKTAVEDLQNNPAQPLELSDVTITGRTVTFHLSDLVTTFSVDIPNPTFAYRDDWLPNENYHASDFFSQGGGLYIVLQDHTSNGVFNAGDGNINGPFYRLVIKIPTEVFEVPFFVRDLSLQGAPLFTRIITQPLILPLGALGSLANLRTLSTSPIEFLISQNDSAIGLLDFAAGDPNGVFDVEEAVGFSPGDLLQIFLSGDVDATAAFLTATLLMQLGELS